MPRVEDPEQLRELRIGQASSPLGSGGMRSKVVAAEMATAAGIPAIICSGLLPGALERAVAGEPVGTEFTPGPTRYSSFKLWLKYAKPTRGRVEVDAGAARALREGGTSLLPVGITAVKGSFDVGDAIYVEAQNGRVGKGITNYTADELRRIKGLHSTEANELVPRLQEEAVHRDYFVLE